MSAYTPRVTELARRHAAETASDMRLTVDYLLTAYDIVESALGAEWLEQQERQSAKHRVKISDAHTLVRLLATPTAEAHAEICELALYLQAFSRDSAIGPVISDLRTEKYAAVFMELAFAYRWRDAGARVRLRPRTAKGEADFEAVLSDLPFVVETSLFAGDIFKHPRFRIPQIIGQAMNQVSFRSAVKFYVTIAAFPAGNVDAQVFEVISTASREFVAGGSKVLKRSFGFADVTVEPIVGDPEYNPFIEAAEGESWDICFRHVKRPLRVGEPIYRVFDNTVAEEISRIFLKLPAADIDIYEAMHRKLKKEAAQLSGVRGPRAVILDTSSLGDLDTFSEEAVKSQLGRIMRNIPELACVWITMRRFLRQNRWRYFSLIVPNADSTYQLPHAFLAQYGTREWRWDYLAGREFS